MKSIILFSVFALQINAGGPILDFFKAVSVTARLIKNPLKAVFSEIEILEEKKEDKIGWSKQDEERLKTLKAAERLRLHNIHQRKMAKAGDTDSAEMVEGGTSGDTAAAPVFEMPAMPIHNGPAMTTLSGSGSGGNPSPGPSMAPPAAPAIPNLTALTLAQLKKKTDELIKTKQGNDSELLNYIKEFIEKSQTNKNAEDTLLKYCDKNKALMVVAANADLLRFAAVLGQLKLVKKFIEIGADVNKISLDGTLPVAVAILGRQCPIFDYLVSLPNFNPNIKDQIGVSVAKRAFNAHSAYFIVPILSHPNFALEEDFETTDALSQDLIRALKALPEIPAMEKIPKEKWGLWANIFHSLVLLGNHKALEHLLHIKPSLINANFGGPPIYKLMQHYRHALEKNWSILQNQSLDTLRILLRADPQIAETIFEEACKHKIPEFIKILKAHCHEIQPTKQATQEITPAPAPAPIQVETQPVQVVESEEEKEARNLRIAENDRKLREETEKRRQERLFEEEVSSFCASVLKNALIEKQQLDAEEREKKEAAEQKTINRLLWIDSNRVRETGLMQQEDRLAWKAEQERQEAEDAKREEARLRAAEERYWQNVFKTIQKLEGVTPVSDSLPSKVELIQRLRTAIPLAITKSNLSALKTLLLAVDRLELIVGSHIYGLARATHKNAKKGSDGARIITEVGSHLGTLLELNEDPAIVRQFTNNMLEEPFAEMLETIRDIYTRDDAQVLRGAGVLYLAAWSNNYALISLLLSDPTVIVNPHFQGCAPLAMAIVTENLESIEALLTKEQLGNICFQGEYLTPAYLAIRNKKLSSLKLILEAMIRWEMNLDEVRNYAIFKLDGTPLLAQITEIIEALSKTAKKT